MAISGESRLARHLQLNHTAKAELLRGHLGLCPLATRQEIVVFRILGHAVAGLADISLRKRRLVRFE